MTESEFGQCRRSVGRIQDVLALLATANLGCSDALYVAEPGPAHLPAGKGTQEAASCVAEPGPAPPAESRDGSSRPRPANYNPLALQATSGVW
jgi:hypothetical protein